MKIHPNESLENFRIRFSKWLIDHLKAPSHFVLSGTDSRKKEMAVIMREEYEKLKK